MSVALLDVNVLVAIFDQFHKHHEDAHRWLQQHRKYGWATCPITINGCVRVLSTPGYPAGTWAPSELIERVRRLCSDSDHYFWADSVVLTDESLFQPSMIRGHRNITDAYLLGLAVRNHGRLATFDQTIPMKAVHGAEPRNLVVIGTV
jgi:toxin-antitoxin system PIN domain toxin